MSLYYHQSYEDSFTNLVCIVYKVQANNKLEVGIHNLNNFGNSKKFFSNLEMAKKIKIKNMKRFDEIWRLDM